MLALPFVPLVVIAVVLFIILRTVVFRNRSFGGHGWRLCQRCGRTCEPHAGFCPRCGQRL